MKKTWTQKEAMEYSKQILLRSGETINIDLLICGVWQVSMGLYHLAYEVDTKTAIEFVENKYKNLVKK